MSLAKFDNRILLFDMKPKDRSKSTKLSPAAQRQRKADRQSSDKAKTISSLILRSRASLEEGDLQAACELAVRACSILPKDSLNVHPLELLGEIQIELGEFEDARNCFLEAVRRRESVPAESFDLGEEGKFLWLGQLSTEDDAEKWYLKGIEVLQSILQRFTSEEQRKLIHEKMRDVYCSLVELFLTDLWFAFHFVADCSMTEKAEENAERYSLLALENDKESPVALSSLASVRLSQSRNDEASTLLQESLSKWLGKSESKPPSYSERMSQVKLLLEVELYEKALEVLETMQREDEENVELWYLYTCTYYHNPEESKEENWKSAWECAEMCLKLYQRMEWDDEEMRNSCLEMLKEIQKSGISVDKNDEGSDGEEDDDGDDDDDDDDDDVEMQDVT